MTIDDKDHALVTAIEKEAILLAGAVNDYDAIVNAAMGKKFVLIGEATHGTKEFYAIRAEITQRLIQEQGFDAIAVEADWPDAYAINRYVSLLEGTGTALESLTGFERFPTWMWRNEEVLKFIDWLHTYNAEWRRPEKEKSPVGFYGLDLYSLSTSIHAVLTYLYKIDPATARLARERYSCLDHFMDTPQAYGYAAEFKLADSCEEEVVAQLAELRQKRNEYLARDGFVAEDDFFNAAQNAKIVKDAEQYYRAMFSGRQNSWNVRDRHMFEALKDLSVHIGQRAVRNAKIIVWAHNSHIGNAAATEMGKQRGEINIGQLMRENYGHDVLSVGFSTSHGSVTAASDWDDPAGYKNVNLPFPGSYEEVFHHVNSKQFIIDLRENNEAVDLLMKPRLQRAIGVVYRPMTERQSHYFNTCLPEQFDFMIHIDGTTAVQPLETIPHWHRGEMDETYPYGI